MGLFVLRMFGLGPKYPRTNSKTKEMSINLTQACLAGDFNTVHALLNMPPAVDINMRVVNGSSQYTPLCAACEGGNEEIVTTLLSYRDTDVNKHNLHPFETPLSLACTKNNLEIIRILISRKQTD